MKVGYPHHKAPLCQLIPTTPFYIDRRVRPPHLASPRCLSPHRLQSIPHFELSLASSPRPSEGKGEKGNQSCEASPRIQHGRISLEWGLLSTEMFKARLKLLLKDYYELQQREQQKQSERNRKERQEQMSRIARSFEELLKTNRLIYSQVKKECQRPTPTGKDQSKGIDIDGNREGRGRSDSHLLTFIQSFTRKYIENDQQSEHRIITEKDIEDRIQNFFHNHNQGDIRFMHTMPLPTPLHTHQPRPPASQTFSDFGSLKLDLNNEANARNLIGEFRHKHGQGEEQVEQPGINLPSQDELNKLFEGKLLPSDSGSEKFYKVIRQLLVRTKIGKQGQDVKPAPLTEQPSKTVTVRNPKQNSGGSKPGILKNSLSSRIGVDKKATFVESINTSPKRDLRKLQENAKERINGSTLSKPKPKEKTEFKLVRKEARKEVGKQGKQNGERKERVKEEQENESKHEKQRRKFQKGVNYAKFINKMLKAAESDRSSSHPQKYKFFKNIKTRQVFIKKKNKYMEEEEPPKEATPEDKAEKAESVKLRKSTGKVESAPSEESEKKGRMTKYEEARLMYNMRNIKSRDIVSTFNNTTANIFNEFERKKRPSFCNLLVVHEEGKPSRSRRGSFSRQGAEEEEDSGMGYVSTRTFNARRSEKSKAFSSSRYMVSQTELADLSTLEEFDLRAVKTNITSYLRKFMLYNEKAKELYNFLMYMEESRKITLEQQEVHSSLDQLKIQKEEEEIRGLVDRIEPTIEDYEGCDNLFDNYRWNEKDLSMLNRKFIDRLDARSIELMYWNTDDNAKAGEDLQQCSLKEIKSLPL